MADQSVIVAPPPSHHYPRSIHSVSSLSSSDLSSSDYYDRHHLRRRDRDRRRRKSRSRSRKPTVEIETETTTYGRSSSRARASSRSRSRHSYIGEEERIAGRYGGGAGGVRYVSPGPGPGVGRTRSVAGGSQYAGSCYGGSQYGGSQFRRRSSVSYVNPGVGGAGPRGSVRSFRSMGGGGGSVRTENVTVVDRYD
ncbi:hypothetical protein EX30DRAFT_342830 [Ascodesmis nigricans]|uniref:Uncharacterized protein n=1 Tax=Ascodesmis nigricans TaxID=341454 RepID=A0A4S2MPJ9_9PEZI|nr:hypothetical protein EX30DRAFT_342830 [Ascodesmis nigricans]